MTSKLKTDVLETVSGSGTISLTNQLSGMTDASMPSGSVVQVKQTYNPSASNTASTSTSFVASGIQLVITPKYANSLLLVQFNTTMTQKTVNGNGMYAQMWMNGSVMAGGSEYHLGYKELQSDYSPMIFSGQYTATSTSTLTFEPHFRSSNTNNLAIFLHVRSSYGLTVTEIKQ